ncbi:MAG: PAS domain S-box protein [Hylemonella sp.]|nr:PAS domain S-box protein [Hylemonella sp.]
MALTETRRERWRAHWRRRLLWSALAALVLALLVTLVWLAGRYEASQLQSKLDRDAADAVSDIRSRLTRNLQSLQALQFGEPLPARWAAEAAVLLRERRELLRIEWRDSQHQILAQAGTPYRPAVFDRLGRDSVHSEVVQACNAARRISGPAYSRSYFVPMTDGLGVEVMEVCLPLASAGVVMGYLVATYSLQDLLDDLAGQLTRSQEVSFTEGDGTRLAMRGMARRSSRVFKAQQLLDLPGTTLVLRIDSWRGAPDLFPNVLTALVTAMSIALVSILLLLGKDMRRRLKAESDLADALAFRKAMEDSLVTGLRARDLEGRISYVNPAFCQMVGFSAEELMGQSANAPYWPPELADEYKKRQDIRLAGNVPPREGFESVFMHKDGTRFPVLIIEAPLINAQGVQTGWMSAFLDIREQRRVEELSRASQDRLQATARLAMVGEMASLLSHELNQPLAAISSYATGMRNLLQRGAHTLADVELAMHRIAEQAERAGKVIKSVHDFVRRRDQAREAVAPLALFDAILPLINLQARKLGVQVQLRLESGLPLVLCDRTMVEQVLLNLARNGMQAMDRPEIRRRVLQLGAKHASPDTRWVEFFVADVGPGIAPEVAQQLFTPFFTTKAEGMGLGLSLCRTVIEQHGGALAFEPHPPQGTVFTFTLPTGSPQAPLP